MIFGFSGSAALPRSRGLATLSCYEQKAISDCPRELRMALKRCSDSEAVRSRELDLTSRTVVFLEFMLFACSSSLLVCLFLGTILNRT